MLWGRALATSLGRLAAGSFARRAKDLLQRRGNNRRPFALRRGWRQAVVRSLAAFKAQGGSDGSVIGAIVQGTASTISSQACLAGPALGYGWPWPGIKRRPGLAAGGVELAAASLELAICQACICHKSDTHGSPTLLMPIVKVKQMAVLSRPLAVLSRPMAVLSRGALMRSSRPG